MKRDPSIEIASDVCIQLSLSFLPGRVRAEAKGPLFKRFAQSLGAELSTRVPFRVLGSARYGYSVGGKTRNVSGRLVETAVVLLVGSRFSFGFVIGEKLGSWQFIDARIKLEIASRNDTTHTEA